MIKFSNVSNLWNRRVFVCLECGYKFASLVKKETDNLDCPHCDVS